MANDTLKGLKVAILIEEGFEQVEMVEPRKALDQAGAETRIVSPRDKHVRGWKLTNWGDRFAVDVALDQARPQEFDALLLPGGVMNPDMLRSGRPSSIPASRSTGSSTRRRSNRVFKSYDTNLDPCCFAWNKLIDIPWRITSMIKRPGISAMINETWYQLMVASSSKNATALRAPQGYVPCNLLRKAQI
jgi:hypothetical protein